ncbi:N-terminal cooper fist DNA-binding domain-containing protein [Trichoderma citrinoviride]|uniref:N-terminal cooper fist DNA-binding domain-containing protein n=1 Tax=Trichoderma citrinoviride TaxID=58853 RepID=A0A2T4BI18_9HYPO|nr:N-terminal cooper fist DNA-binding domain-containing protein [Trichoderma citrinoviride]PTB68974.1 N-terminal cooper fist DNA-binding domain-containing protein [Trichoderma citrinoviride]
MPLINGQKMACEPCIRGHRSTKCTHASERLMVPVRKPGRPLSSCPHPSAQPCGCAAVTAAFPRKQKCRRCETSDKPSGCKPGGQEDKETSNGLVTPPSPSQKAPAPKTTYRIQKTSSKNGTGKKQIDLSGLERMDASQLNILSSPESKPSPSQLSNGTVPTTPAAPLPGQGMMGFISNGRSFSLGPAMFPLQSGLECLLPVNGHIDSESLRPNESNAGPAAGSCCGGGNSNFPPTHAQSLANADSSGTEIKPRGSISTPGVGPPVNGLIMPQFNAQMNMPNVPLPYFAQPGVFAYPPQYGSFQQPLQPDQWRQLMATMHFTHPMTNMQDAPYDETAQVQFPQNNGLEAPWTSHQCGCGDSCECIGCATHPYNQATQDYVRSAWNSMQEDAPKGHRHSDSTHSPLIGNNGTPTPANQSPNGGSTPTGGQVEGLVSPTMAQTPSESNSVLGEEAALSASDFFFVSYPFGDLCEGEKAKCPCGDDCSCIGCSIHNISPAPAEFGST